MNDLISRQAAIDALRECQTYLFDEQDPDKKISLKSAEYAIEDLPSAQPEKVCIANITLSEEQLREAVEKAKNEVVRVLSSAQPEQRWIPVSERLPEEKFSVLVWCPEILCVFCAYMQEDKWWIFGASHAEVLHDVTAWMPLPEPYKMVGEQNG